MILFKKQLFDLEVKGQGPTKVIMVCDTPHRSCTHIPNIIDLSGKTKKLWSVQASLRKSGRKNQTKTMSPFVGLTFLHISKASTCTNKLYIF